MGTISRTILNGWHVLVVEDEPDSLDIVLRVLTHYSAQVTTARNGQEALDALKKIKPHFIISDLSMPGMNGWQLIDTLKRERETSEIPVIALTAHALLGDREKAISAGFHNYLTKPLTVSTFMTNLLALLVEIPQLKEDLVNA